MGGMQPGDKLTAQNLNDNYMCRTDDTDSTGSIKTSKYFINGKRNEPSSAGQTLVADVGIINLTEQAPIAVGDATTLSPDAVAGLQDGQELTIVNSSGADYTLNFTSPAVSLNDGAAFSFVYCAAEGDWIPTGTETQNPLICDVDGAAPGNIGDLVYKGAFGSGWSLADNSALATIGTHMIVATDATTYSVQAVGPVTIPGHGFTLGDQYYGDPATIGGVTSVPPTGLGEIIRPAFNVISTDKIQLELVNDPTVISSGGGPAVSPQYVSAERTASQGPIPANGVLNIFYNSNLVDAGSNYNTATGTYTAPVAGVYVVSASADIRSSSGFANAVLGNLSVLVNGTKEMVSTRSGNSTGSSQDHHVTSVLLLAAGDTVNIQAGNGDGGTRDIHFTNSFFKIARVADA